MVAVTQPFTIYLAAGEAGGSTDSLTDRDVRMCTATGKSSAFPRGPVGRRVTGRVVPPHAQSHGAPFDERSKWIVRLGRCTRSEGALTRATRLPRARDVWRRPWHAPGGDDHARERKRSEPVTEHRKHGGDAPDPLKLRDAERLEPNRAE